MSYKSELRRVLPAGFAVVAMIGLGLHQPLTDVLTTGISEVSGNINFATILSVLLFGASYVVQRRAKRWDTLDKAAIALFGGAIFLPAFVPAVGQFVTGSLVGGAGVFATESVSYYLANIRR